MAGAGGAFAVNGGESVGNATTTTRLTLQMPANSAHRSQIAVSGDLTVQAVNEDTYDSKIDASAIAAASVTGGLAASTGVADVGVRFGDYTEVDTTSLSVVSNNRFAKDWLH